MKLEYSFLSRRKFLNSLFAGGILTFLSTLLYPVVRFIIPPSREPEEVILPLDQYQDMLPYTSRIFSWGSKPGILLKKKDEYKAFVGTCTHFDCNVAWKADEKKFFCACHEGWYDENGVNIEGPPPSPLRQLSIEINGENIIVKQGEKKS